MSKLRTFKKEKWGDRPDGRWIKGTGLQTIMANVMPNRTDSEVCCRQTIDATELVPGPIYLQGDHSDASFRNMVVTPILKELF